MTASIVLGAIRPWTYWLAPAFVLAGLVLMAVVAVGYHGKVMVPSYRRRLLEQTKRRGHHATADVRPLPMPASVATSRDQLAA